jgi:exosortase
MTEPRHQSAGCPYDEVPPVAFLLPLGLGLLLFAWPTLTGLAGVYRTDDNFSHGFLVPLIAAYAAWRRRHELIPASGSARLLGVIPLAAGLGLVLFSRWYELALLPRGVIAMFMAGLGLVLALTGMAWIAVGWQGLKRLTFPLGYLLLGLPIPSFLLHRVTIPLQQVAAIISTAALHVMGVTVQRQGNVLTFPAGQLGVDEACSGIRSLAVLTAVVLAMIHFNRPTRRGSVLLLLAIVPLAVLTNAVRVFTSGIFFAIGWKQLTHGGPHELLGLFTFALAIGGLAALTSLLSQRPEPASRAEGEEGPRDQRTKGPRDQKSEVGGQRSPPQADPPVAEEVGGQRSEVGEHSLPALLPSTDSEPGTPNPQLPGSSSPAPRPSPTDAPPTVSVRPCVCASVRPSESVPPSTDAPTHRRTSPVPPRPPPTDLGSPPPVPHCSPLTVDSPPAPLPCPPCVPWATSLSSLANAAFGVAFLLFCGAALSFVLNTHYDRLYARDLARLAVRRPLSEFPVRVGPYVRIKSQDLSEGEFSMLDPSEQNIGIYLGPDGRQFTVTILYWNPPQGRPSRRPDLLKRPHSPDWCYPAAGWNRLRHLDDSCAADVFPGEQGRVRVFERDRQSMVVLYWTGVTAARNDAFDQIFQRLVDMAHSWSNPPLANLHTVTIGALADTADPTAAREAATALARELAKILPDYGVGLRP